MQVEHVRISAAIAIAIAAAVAVVVTVVVTVAAAIEASSAMAVSAAAGRRVSSSAEATRSSLPAQSHLLAPVRQVLFSSQDPEPNLEGDVSWSKGK
ncbi:hypothetical protein BP5796_08730 [Coleophoma crateriformis]|uniref:Uncharacterized protein n=1 Tax=Coleophoma crateriformis TaxID=565419 RepID=A0A3D8R8F5_9HELO|nr:hypothetical protein BP5796_08730 [Coleophoma crateriformis]